MAQASSGSSSSEMSSCSLAGQHNQYMRLLVYEFINAFQQNTKCLVNAENTESVIYRGDERKSWNDVTSSILPFSRSCSKRCSLKKFIKKFGFLPNAKKCAAYFLVAYKGFTKGKKQLRVIGKSFKRK